MDRPSAHRLGHEVGVPAHAVAMALDLHHRRVVEQPVQQRGRDHGVAEDVMMPPILTDWCVALAPARR